MIRLETERLSLRRLLITDVPHLSEMLADREVMKFYGPLANSQTPETWFEKVDAAHQQRGSSFLAVERKEGALFLGQAGVLFHEVDGVIEQEMAYMLRKEYWGKGYASEASRACLKYAYENFQPKRFISLIHPKNERSIQVAKRNGMKFDRFVTKWDMQVAVYAIDAANWKALFG